MIQRWRFAWAWFVGAVLLSLAGCGGELKPCDAAAIACTVNGGKWTPGPNCGTCEYPLPPPPPPDPCAACTDEQTCVDGKCVDPEPDPCDKCTPEQTCKDGQCIDPPSLSDCPFNTPTAEWMVADGRRCGVYPVKEGRKNFGATPTCDRWPKVNGRLYYCQPGLWPEACAAGRRGGPVAPPGHPKKVACEAQFYQRPCAMFSLKSSKHMSYDPWYVIGGVNQNHPRNVRVCGQGQFETHPSWVKEDYRGHLYVVAGEWSIASAHTTREGGEVCTAAKGGAFKRCVKYKEP